ncbi:uncharacterized protein VTP21DRAFT_8614 [Calcarisporiella thermophila]|uniref:uncharacterized protein n=1 Tax=Calcarisporiella thermophila TaxID=911321 RepID=UPI003743C373
MSSRDNRILIGSSGGSGVENPEFTRDSLDEFLQSVAPVTPRSKSRTTTYSTPELSRTSNRISTPSNRPGVIFSPSSQNSPLKPSAQGVKFAERTNKGKVEEIFNSSIPLSKQPALRKRCHITTLEGQMEAYRYMFEKIMNKADVLDDRIEYFAEVYQQHYGFEYFGHPAYPSQDAFTTIGRICCDAEGRLNDQSVMLEASRAIGGGSRVKLILNETQEFALFPGQIVALEGVNSSGNSIVVSKIYPLPPPDLYKSKAQALLDFNYSEQGLAGAPMTVFVASGPYTFEDNLSYEPLIELLAKVEEEKPDLGPFLDQDHPLIREGKIDQLPSEIFHSRISYPLSQLEQNCPGTNIVLVPSTKDICHEYTVLPQPPLLRSGGELGLPRNIETVPNPAVFSVNEVKFGVISADMLFLLGAEEIARFPNGMHTDRLARLSKHLLEQRSFYPLSPHSLAEPLSYSHLSQLNLLHSPDILILPSQLKHFTKVLDPYEVVCVNPGRLTRKQAGGTYAKLTIQNIAREKLEKEAPEETELKHYIKERCRVDIVRV